MIYISYFLISIIICLFIDQNSGRNRTIALFLISLLTFLFIGFSYPAGGDWIGYFNNYNCQINSVCYSNFILFEPGYQLIVNTVGHLGYFAITVTIAAINIILLWRFAKNFQNSALVVLMLMCLFLWGMFTEAIRQGLAFCVILYAIPFLYKNNIYKYILLVVLASLFHVTAAISIIFVLPYMSKTISRIVVTMLFVFGVMFFIFPTQILKFILIYLPAESSTNLKLDFYINSETYSPGVSIGLGLTLDILLLFVLFISNKRIKRYQLYNSYKFYLATLLGLGVYVAFSMIIGRIMPVLTRVGWYGFPMLLMLVYTNIGWSTFYKSYNKSVKKKFDLIMVSIIIYFAIQPLRPLSYPYSYYGIINQKTLIQKSSELNDESLTRNAYEKCSILTNLGYGYLCD